MNRREFIARTAVATGAGLLGVQPFGTRFGTKQLPKAKSGTPRLPKCPIRLVGRQGLEPWTR